MEEIVVDFKNAVPAKLLGSITCFYNKGDEFLGDDPFEFSVSLEGGIASGGRIKISSIDLKNPVSDCGDDATQNKSLGGIFLLGFLGGLIALITPCVFPMIPVTVTFSPKITWQKERNCKCCFLRTVYLPHLCCHYHSVSYRQ